MRFLGDDEPAAFELLMDFTEHPAVGQWIPCLGIIRCGYFPQLIPAD
jgi:hypothetical protein